MSWLDKLKLGMKKTARLLNISKVDFSSLDELEEALISADVGVALTSDIMARIRQIRPDSAAEIKEIIRAEVIKRLGPVARELEIDPSRKPFVILVAGVNGAGKTTTIGKLGQYYTEKGMKVSFVAGDTFRAGAVEQLQKWGEKVGCQIYKAAPNADAAGLIYDSLQKSIQEKDDIIFIDTAGRLHNKSHLMDELKKIDRVIKKLDASAPHETLLVLDATIGQNALAQVDAFAACVSISGLVMTKLDGTAKGGILLALTDKYHLPVVAIGVGEKADDLRPFTAQEYADSLIGESQ
ncbi:MAG: signal recognition particle-docking protein FtsY [Lactobacillales bacterium]|jgi:fused signal recognition particle receptor|nr:signal recognition particle-docking protein FtsY [Lactobacillales bacterium]